VPVPLRPDPEAVQTNAVRSLMRGVIALGLHALDRRTLPADYAARTWPHDAEVHLVLRAAVNPTFVADVPGVARFTQAFLTALGPQSAGAELLSRGLALRFGGHARIDIPVVGIPAADFVAEGAPIPVTQPPPIAGVAMTPHKLACVVTITREMLISPSAEEVILAVLRDATGPAIDRALFSGAAASPERPAGLLNGITPLIATGTSDDLVKLIAAIAPVSGNAQLALVASPQMGAEINLLPRALPYPVLVSTALPGGTIIAVALPALVSAVEVAPRIDASTQAVVHQETVPAQIVDLMATPVRSLFQTDTVGLRLRWPISWALRDPRAVAWMVR
jgi:hypothetical protein